MRYVHATGNTASLPPTLPTESGRSSGAPGRWLTAGLAGVVAGTAVQLQQPALWDARIYLYFCVIAVVLYTFVAIKKIAIGSRWMAPVVCFLAATLAFGAAGGRSAWFASHALDPALEGRDIRITAWVVAMPQRNDGGSRLRLQVDQAVADGQPVRLPMLIDAGWYNGSFMGVDRPKADAQAVPPDLRAGDQWELTVRLKAPHGQRNPHGFDYELWLWEQGVQATGYVRAGPRDAPPSRLAQSWRYPVERARQAVRDAIFDRLAYQKSGALPAASAKHTDTDASTVSNPLPAIDSVAARMRVAGVVAALVTGDQRAIDQADWDIFRATGVAHLVSISGLHITLFAWAAALVIGALWRCSSRLCLTLPAPVAALAGGVLLAATYALFSGWGVPSQRTIWMLATVALLRIAGRSWPWPQVWLLACAVVVAIDPWALLQAGFWLSFVAVGVLFATDSGAVKTINPAAEDQFPTRFLAQFLNRCIGMLREQWVVTVALTPLTLLLFGQVSVVGLAANLLAIPWVTLVVTPLALLGVVLPLLWDAAAMAVQLLGHYLHWLASFSWATYTAAVPPLWAGVAGVVGGALLAMRLPWSLRLLGLPLVLPLALWLPHRPAPGTFELLAADIGQGNAVLVRTASHTLVYDTGPRLSRESDAGNRVLVPLLRAMDEKVDLVMLSHRDIDHTGGAPAVLAMQPQARLTGSLEDGHPLLALRQHTRCTAGQRWDWDGVIFEVLHPRATDYSATAKSNALSCVLRITGAAAPQGDPARHIALLVGDIEQPQEARLVQSGVSLRAGLLLVPHHGSKTSSSAVFLDAVQPQIALVQAGYRNRFGHPAPEVLARYLQRGVQMFDSPRCGAAVWSSATPDAVQCERDASRRYWHH